MAETTKASQWVGSTLGWVDRNNPLTNKLIDLVVRRRPFANIALAMKQPHLAWP